MTDSEDDVDAVRRLREKMNGDWVARRIRDERDKYKELFESDEAIDDDAWVDMAAAKIQGQVKEYLRDVFGDESKEGDV